MASAIAVTPGIGEPRIVATNHGGVAVDAVTRRRLAENSDGCSAHGQLDHAWDRHEDGNNGKPGKHKIHENLDLEE